MTDDEKKQLGRSGLIVANVTAEKPGQRAGLTAGDVVTSLDGASMTDPKAFSEMIDDADEGVLMKVSVFRDGRDVVLSMRLPGETPEERAKREEEEQAEREREEQEAQEEQAEAEAEAEAERAEAESPDGEASVDADGDPSKSAADTDSDLFGWTGCCVCSAFCPPLAPVFAATAFFVRAEVPPPKEPPRDDVVVRY